MKIAVDTNVLLRAFLGDDDNQSELAAQTLKEADLVAITLPTICEFVWVLKSRYGATRPAIAAALQAIVDTRNVVIDRGAIEAGLAMLGEGGDFVDGVIAQNGSKLGGDIFVSFDQQAVRLWKNRAGPRTCCNRRPRAPAY